MLVEASPLSKAPLVLMVCEKGVPQQHKHEPMLLEPPWRTKDLLVPML